MTYGELNGHIIDDVTGPRKVKLVTRIRLEPNISKTAGDAIWQRSLLFAVGQCTVGSDQHYDNQNGRPKWETPDFIERLKASA